MTKITFKKAQKLTEQRGWRLYRCSEDEKSPYAPYKTGYLVVHGRHIRRWTNLTDYAYNCLGHDDGDYRWIDGIMRTGDYDPYWDEEKQESIVPPEDWFDYEPPEKALMNELLTNGEISRILIENIEKKFEVYHKGDKIWFLDIRHPYSYNDPILNYGTIVDLTPNAFVIEAICAGGTEKLKVCRSTHRIYDEDDWCEKEPSLTVELVFSKDATPLYGELGIRRASWERGRVLKANLRNEVYEKLTDAEAIIIYDIIKNKMS